MKKEVNDPAIREKLTPNYTIGCKRILRSDDYYPTFNRSNVKLVTESIERFTPQGIVTADGTEHQLDAVVFGTGFVAADMDFYTQIIGRDGRNLIAEWKDKGAEVYLGTTVSGYPNLAFILGPNTGLGHNSVVLMMEAQMNYIMQYIAYLEESGNGLYLDVKEQEQQAYNERLQEQFEGTVWTSGCKSWYVNKNGKNTTLYPRLVTTFQKQMKNFNPAAYHLQQKIKEPATSPVLEKD
ncbi:flavin-containing monooxygenase [Pontibacter diazotrophicus]|uniref:flavin-containing monooxygenase n=1 Tax=Pontibacter diazotrophicus TaxID=1400979 RepID=UPI001FE52D3C|nr:NAD(P)/FAD-dependent oxidoreductase [Pontibacter diazotrophicus]